jgi:hypothetical protein
MLGAQCVTPTKLEKQGSLSSTSSKFGVAVTGMFSGRLMPVELVTSYVCFISKVNTTLPQTINITLLMQVYPVNC